MSARAAAARHVVRVVVTQPRDAPRLALARIAERRRAARDRARAAAILPSLPPRPGAIAPAAWRVQRVERPRWTPSGVTAVMAGPPGRRSEVVLKLPHSSEGAASLRRQRAVQLRLRADPRLAELRDLIPEPVAEGEHGGEYYAAERMLHGALATREIVDPARRAAVLAAAAATIGRLHGATATPEVVGAAHLRAWVDEPLHVIGRAQQIGARTSSAGVAIERVRAELHDALEGRHVQTGWIHGDFWPGNLILVPGAPRLAGIVDWDRAAAGQLPGHDLYHLLLYTRRFVSRTGTADVVAGVTGRLRWTPAELAVLRAVEDARPADPITSRTMTLLYWLRHTAATLTLTPGYAADPAYVADNVTSVLEHV